MKIFSRQCTALFALVFLFSFSSKNSFGQSGETSQAIDTYLQKAATNGYSGSVLVAKSGKILLEKGYGLADRETKRPQTAETPFSVGSITKQFTATAIVKLETMGKLSVSDPLSKYWPDAPVDKAGITLHQLLTHSAGFPGALGDDYEAVDGEAFMKLAFQSELLFPPGAGYEYSNVGYSILGILVERISGKNYEMFLRENLFLPAGMTQTGYLSPGFKKENLAVGYRNGERWGTALDRPWLSDGPGWHLRANGGIISTVGDMHKWYKALINSTVLPKTAVEKMFTPYVREGEGAPSFYGYGWVVQDMEGGQRQIWHNGGNSVYNAFMGFVPAEDVVVIVSSNSNQKISDDLAQRIWQVLQGDEMAFLPDDFLQKFTGNYRLPSGENLTANFDENNSLTIQYDDAEVVSLLLTDGSENAERTAFFSKKSQMVVEQSLKGNYQPVANALEVPLAEAADMEGQFWEQVQGKNGTVKSIEVLGTVARKAQGVHLTLVRVRCENGTAT